MAGNNPCFGIDHADHIRKEHIGKELAFHDLQCVEKAEGFAVFRYGKPACLLKSFLIEKPQLCRAVTHDEPAAIILNSPPLAAVAECPEQAERVQIIYKTDTGLESDLNQLFTPQGQSLTKVVIFQVQL